jgi:hypothetical protein
VDCTRTVTHLDAAALYERLTRLETVSRLDRLVSA